MEVKCFPVKDISTNPFCPKLNWTSRHTNIIQRLFNLKVASVGFIWAAPKCTQKIVDCWVSLPGCQILIVILILGPLTCTIPSNRLKSVFWCWKVGLQKIIDNSPQMLWNKSNKPVFKWWKVQMLVLKCWEQKKLYEKWIQIPSKWLINWDNNHQTKWQCQWLWVAS